eukprot:5360204-Amphidinium_carterae.3
MQYATMPNDVATGTGKLDTDSLELCQGSQDIFEQLVRNQFQILASSPAQQLAPQPVPVMVIQEHSSFGMSSMMHVLIVAEHDGPDQRPQLPAIDHADHGVTVLKSVAPAQIEMADPAPGSVRQSYLNGRD